MRLQGKIAIITGGASGIDVSSVASWDAVIAETVTAFGRLDVLVNCAGISIPGDIETTSA